MYNIFKSTACFAICANCKSKCTVEHACPSLIRVFEEIDLPCITCKHYDCCLIDRNPCKACVATVAANCR